MVKQRGFTLIELVVVILILGVLAAIALPRFADIGQQARLASINGVAGGLRAAVAVVQSTYLARNQTTSPVVMFDGTNVTVNTGVNNAGVPVASAAGIGNAMQPGNAAGPFEGYTTAYPGVPTGSATFTLRTNCLVTYNGTSGLVTTTAGGC